MADMLETAMTWLAAQQKEHASRTVTYTRGAYSVSVSATIGRTETEFADGGARSRTDWSDRDYLIASADLVLNGSTVTPAKGDRITDGTEVREVTPIDGEPHFRASDNFAVRWRIHTKRVA